VPSLLALITVLSVLHLLAVADYTISRAGQSLPEAIRAAVGLRLNWYEGRTGYLPGNWDVLWSLSIKEVSTSASRWRACSRVGAGCCCRH
jgi:hypothetical protein